MSASSSDSVTALNVVYIVVGESVRRWTATIADVLFVLLAVVLVCFLVGISVRAACCEAAPSRAADGANVGASAAPIGKPARPPSQRASSGVRKEVGVEEVRYQMPARDSVFVQAQRSTVIIPLSARRPPLALASLACGRCGDSVGPTSP